MSLKQYETFLNEHEVVRGTEDAKLVSSIGKDIAKAAQTYFNYKGQPNLLDEYDWEYRLVKSDQVNAWCMPGGKIVFYTGILPIAKNEAGIAAIMGHEVAHALANHGQQRMSAGMIQQGVGVGVALATKDKSASEQTMWMQAFAVGSSVGGMLPFSRLHETEADEIGLFLTAIAGYNPDEASLLWERMKANSGGQGPPEFLSTHPSNDSRISNLRSLSNQAKVEARKFGVTSFR